MCGIAGFWCYRSGRPADSGVLHHMVESLRHRGPDDDGYWIDGSLGLGMRRLEVVDVAGGRQPMPNEDGSVRVIFNGEIYNHQDLRRELQDRGHRFRTRSDTEAIVHAYEEWGPDCVERFVGMFAFAVWDARRQRLLLARDRLGIKPLYFFEGPEGLVFASELKAVVGTPWVPVEWDLEALDDFLTYEYVPTPRTIVQGVRKLPAATVRVYDAAGRVTTRRYWDLENGAARPTSPEEACEELRTRLSDAVGIRLVADVPLGAFLSGGIDSTIVVGLMSRHAGGGVRSFSIGFDDPSYDELAYARVAAGFFDTRHTEQIVDPKVVDLAEELAGFLDEPFGDVSTFPTYLVSGVARQGVTVALSGDGGDELFAGYDQYRAARWADRLRRLAANPAWTSVDRLLEALPPGSSKKGPVNKLKRFAEGLRRPSDLEQARWWVFWDLAERRRLYRPETFSAVADRDPYAHYRSLLREGSERGFRGLQRQLYADLRGYLADDILVKVDRMSMAVSLEARVPYLDHRVVEYAMTIPAEWKLRRGRTKWILREAFRDVLPPVIRSRGKEGFSMPMKNWLRGPLRPMLTESLEPRRIAERGWFDGEEVGRLVEEHLAGRKNHAHRLWCLICLELSLTGLERRVGERPRLSGRAAAG